MLYVRRSLEKLVSRDFDKLIIAHGVGIKRNAKSFVESTFQMADVSRSKGGLRDPCQQGFWSFHLRWRLFSRTYTSIPLVVSVCLRLVDLRQRRALTWRTVSNRCILEKLGGGGMGVVCTKGDTHLDRFVALKFILEDLARDRQALLPSILSGPTVGFDNFRVISYRLLKVVWGEWGGSCSSAPSFSISSTL